MSIYAIRMGRVFDIIPFRNRTCFNGIKLSPSRLRDTLSAYRSAKITPAKREFGLTDNIFVNASIQNFMERTIL